MAIMTDDQLRAEFARLACEYAALKVPYQHRGTDRHGCDCTGLLIGIAREIGFLRNYRLRNYCLDWNLHAGAGDYILTELTHFADPLAQYLAEPGDIPIMSFGRCAAHAGILVKPLMMVHSWRSGCYCRYAKLTKSMWAKRWNMTFRWNLEKLEALCR